MLITFLFLTVLQAKFLFPLCPRGIPLKLYGEIKKKDCRWSAIARRPLSSQQIFLNVLAVFSRLLKKKKKKCQAAATLSSQRRWFYSQVSHFFWLIRELFFVSSEKQRMRQKDRGSAQLLTTNTSGWGNTAQHVPGCFSLGLWHICCDTAHHRSGLVFWPDGELSLGVNLIHQSTADPTGQCMPASINIYKNAHEMACYEGPIKRNTVGFLQG